eukprot:CAMPEP_0172787668 /NCGR_PEP_ID=MMETSP1074-20121228/206565_1 /TAXON_ID=2916 /ORGANISM="Ceratium fusus, Strain PA161109" /LENGTH=245 /DNA_ID=CAMNT_0013624689 /DNA_START=107 /DNA_END=844 /DNA_ORIENTATION=-
MICLKLLSSEICVDKNCRFAHSLEELQQWHMDISFENSRNVVATFTKQKGQTKEDHKLQGETQDTMMDPREWDTHDEFIAQSDDFSRQATGDLGENFNWQQARTEDALASVVQQTRVKFITVMEEDEVGENPCRPRARSAPAMRLGTIDQLQGCPQMIAKPKVTLPNAEAFDFDAEGELLSTSKDPSADSDSGEDFAMMHLQFGQKAIFPSPPKDFLVADSCNLALSASLLVPSQSRQHGGSVPT